MTLLCSVLRAVSLFNKDNLKTQYVYQCVAKRVFLLKTEKVNLQTLAFLRWSESPEPRGKCGLKRLPRPNCSQCCLHLTLIKTVLTSLGNMFVIYCFWLFKNGFLQRKIINIPYNGKKCLFYVNFSILIITDTFSGGIFILFMVVLKYEIHKNIIWCTIILEYSSHFSSWDVDKGSRSLWDKK